MNPSGLWRGVTTDGRMGHFKFINVEMLPQKSAERKRSDRRKRSNASNKAPPSVSNRNDHHQQSGTPHDSGETSVDIRSDRSSQLLSSTAVYKDYNDDTRSDDAPETSVVKRTFIQDESSSNSRPKTVEDLLRRIGLEVKKMHKIFSIFVIIIQDYAISYNIGIYFFPGTHIRFCIEWLRRSRHI